MKRPSLLLPSVAAALLVAVPAFGQLLDVTSVTTSPAVPTWQDRVEIRVAGSTSCGGAVGAAARVEDGAIEVDLEPDCPADAVARPFNAHAAVDPLDPGVYDLRIVADGELLHQAALVVRRPADGFDVLLPNGPVTDDDDVVLLLSAHVSCGVQVEPLPGGDRLLAFAISSDCPILPPQPTWITVPVPLGKLDAGTWEIRFFLGTGGPESRVLTRTLEVHSPAGCVPSDTVLCLNDGRFRVQAAWKDFQGGEGVARAVPFADREDTGAFWFFSPDNLELTVKVLDGCGVNGHYWAFVSPGSTTEWSLTVTDTRTAGNPGAAYGNALGRTPRLVADTTAFSTCP